MSRHTINDLRDHLFQQLQQLNDTSKPADIARARAVSELGQTIINSLKVELDYFAIIDGATDVPFIEDQTPRGRADTPPEQKVLGPMEKTAAILTAAPSPDHPWRKRARP